MKLVRLLTFLLSFLFAGQIFAVSYTGTDYTVDLPKGSWETTLDEDAGDGYDTFESDTMIVQVFAPNSDVYEVIKSGKKKDIAAMFLAYKKSVGSKDMKKERMKKGKTGAIYYSSFSFTVDNEDDDPVRSYGYFCVVNNDSIEGAYMVNILQDTPVNQAKAYNICNSIRPTGN